MRPDGRLPFAHNRQFSAKIRPHRGSAERNDPRERLASHLGSHTGVSLKTKAGVFVELPFVRRLMARHVRRSLKR